jgi:hypothetical protein
MSSSISGFRPLIVALAAIFCIEAATYIVVKPSFFERSNYLGFNYLNPEKFF